MVPQHGQLFVLSAPTGGGKTSLAKTVVAALADKIAIKKVITYTTRPIRSNEYEGQDYFFVNQERFLNKEHAGFFLETTRYDGNFYGSPRFILDEMQAGMSFVIVTDRPGAKHLKAMVPDAILIWIDVPDLATVSQRLHQRGREDEATLNKRITMAQHEIAAEAHEHTFDYHVMNDEFATAVAKLAEIILQARQQHKKIG